MTHSLTQRDGVEVASAGGAMRGWARGLGHDLQPTWRFSVLL